MKSWVLPVEEDPDTGDLYIQLSEEILENSGMKIGDYLHWVDNKDGSYTLMKEDLTTFVKGAYNKS